MLSIFAITLLVIAAAHSAPNICDICTCLPGRANLATSVTCACTSTQNINTTRDNMKGLDYIKTFSASHCNSLVFHPNSFADAHALQSVTVSHVQDVVYPSGVFTALSVLKVEDVAALRLEERAFMGVAGVLSEIIIRRSTLDELPTHALFGVHDLRRFELTDVVINNIRSKSINIVMDQGSQFIVDNCKVAHIASEAIVLTTNKLQITNSDFAEVSSQAVNVTARTKVEINSTRFGAGCNQDGLLVKSNLIFVTNNTFNVLPIGLLNTFDSSFSRIIFSSNTINNFTLKGINWNAIDFYNNIVNCDCELSKAALAFKTLNDYSVDNLYEYNYCKAKCERKISLNMLVEERDQLCNDVDSNHIDIDVLCDSETSTTEETTDYEISTTPADEVTPPSYRISGRAGRAEISGNDDSESDESTTEVLENEHRNSVTAHQVSSSSRITGIQLAIGILLCALKIYNYC